MSLPVAMGRTNQSEDGEARVPENLAPLQHSGLTALSEVLPALGNPELFWQARHLDLSPYLEHLPFVFWIVTTMRPRSILTLDLTDGVAHFAACQAIEALANGGRCLGLRRACTSETEEKQAGQLALETYGETTYPDISQIVTTTRDQDPEAIEESSVDLVMVETLPSDALRQNFEQIWLPKLSAQGVVLLPGSREENPLQEARLWFERLFESFETVDFPHSLGLTALIVGSSPPIGLEHMARLFQAGEVRHQVQQFFENVGQINAQTVALRDARKARAAASQRETNNWNWAIRLQNEQRELKEAFDARHEAAARVQAELFDSRSEVLQLRQQLEAGNLQGRTYPGDLKDRLTTLKAELEARLQENAALQEQLQKHRVALEQIEADQADEILAMAATIDIQSRELRDLRAQSVPDPAATPDAGAERFEEIAVLIESLEQKQRENARLARELALAGKPA